MNLILFSASFPYIRGGEASFLSNELQHLSKAFNQVVIIPETIKEPTLVELFGIKVDTDYAHALASKSLIDLALLAFSSQIFRKGFLEQDFPLFSITAWRRLIAFAGKAELTRRWIIDWIHRQNITIDDWLFYTYWFDHAAAGIGSAKQQNPNIKVVSRAHGYDIYEERYTPAFWPCRRTVLKTADQIFVDSLAGTEYLKERYPQFSHIFETSLLGVRDPGFTTKASTDHVFRIVSCSRISAEKRVELLLQGILNAARQRPQQNFEWHHFGNGDKREQLQKLVDETFPPNVKAYFPGFSNGETLMNFYKNNPIDIFVNSSITEGTSVAIMEAISCGIPVLATNVGGNSEIVSEQNGLLISDNPSPEDFAAAFFKFIDSKDKDIKRLKSKEKWQAHYSADKNFLEFTQKLINIRMNKT